MEHIDQMANRFKGRLRPLVKAIDFQATAANKPLMAALHFLKTALQKEKPLTQYKLSQIPQHFLPAKSKRYLYTDDKQLLVDRYEFFIYRLLRNNLESGDVSAGTASGFVVLKTTF